MSFLNLFHLSFGDNNFPKILRPFAHCIVHITTYSLQDSHLSGFLHSVQFLNSFSTFAATTRIPLIVSHYSIKPDYSLRYPYPNRTRSAFPFAPGQRRTPNCSVELYHFPHPTNIFHGVLHSLPGSAKFRWLVPWASGHHDALAPPVFNNQGVTFGYFEYSRARSNSGSEFVPKYPKSNVFRLLLVNQKQYLETKWNRYVIFETLSKIQGASNAAYLFVIVLPGSNKQTKDYCWHYTYMDQHTNNCLLLRICNRSLLTVHSLMATLIKKLTEKMNSSPSPRIIQVEDRSKPGIRFGKSVRKMLKLGVPSRFIHFEGWMPVDVLLLSLAFRNFTFKTFETMLFKGEPDFHVFFQVPHNLFMYLEDDGLQFISCAGVQPGSLSLIGYFSAFQPTVWTCLASAILGTVIILLFITEKISLLTIVSSLLYPVTVLLEQGANVSITASSARKVHVSFLSACWIVIGIVISNAYKGQNITDLCSPVQPVPLKYFRQLVQLNFTLFARDVEFMDAKLASLYFYRLNPTLSESFDYEPYLLQLPKRYTIGSPILAKVAKGLSPDAKIYPLVSDLFSQVKFLDHKRLLHAISNSTTLEEGYLSLIKSCHNSAFISWAAEIGNSEHILRRLIMTSNNRSSSHFISVGRQILFPRSKTWQVEKLRLADSKLYQKLATLVESGIGKQWNDWYKRVKVYNDSASTQRRLKNQPQKLQLNDNIVVIFYGHAVLLCCSSILFFLLFIHKFLYNAIFLKSLSYIFAHYYFASFGCQRAPELFTIHKHHVPFLS